MEKGNGHVARLHGELTPELYAALRAEDAVGGVWRVLRRRPRRP